MNPPVRDNAPADARGATVPRARRAWPWLLAAALVLGAMPLDAPAGSKTPDAGPRSERPGAVGESAARLRVGLVLGGGGAKGFAHVGVLKILDSLGVPIDCIAGTSMGGIVGALHAVGWTGAEIETHVRATDWEEIFSDQPARRVLPYLQKQQQGRYQLEFGLHGLKVMSPSGWIFGQKLELLFTDLVHPYDAEIDFDDLPAPVRCVALDLVTGNTVVLHDGSLAKAMRATMAIPTIFSPVPWGDSLLVDGGGPNNLPVDVARAMGADIVIAVDLGQPVRRQDLRSAIGVLERWVGLTGTERYRENLARADLLIRPDIRGYSSGDFEAARIEAILARGERAGRAAAGRIDSLLTARGIERCVRPFARAAGSARGAPPLVERLEVTGNATLPGTLLFRWLGLEEGRRLERPLLAQRIMELYGLGYFENIAYSTRNTGSGRIALTLHVRERPARRLRVGLRYDDHHKLVAAVGVQSNNLPWPGLRLEHELQFAGLTRYQARASYPSRTLTLPVYPFLGLRYKSVPTDVFGARGDRVASYDDETLLIEGGIGFQLFKAFNTELACGHEAVDVDSRVTVLDQRILAHGRAGLNLLRASMDVDALDDVFVPTAGFRFEAGWEGSHQRLDSDVEYQAWQLAGNAYHTLGDRHTFRVHGLWFQGRGELPVYKMASVEVPWSFVGADYDQLRAERIALARVDYRHKWKRDIFLKLIGNVVGDYRSALLGSLKPGTVLWGWGAGLQVLSPVGPVEVILARGSAGVDRPRSDRGLVYVTIGYRF